MSVFILIVLGLALGSFINAFVWRFHIKSIQKSKKPDKKYSIVYGHSMCPNCKHRLSPLDLVPVLSWLFLAGKCRYCKKPISWQYPLIELVTPGLFIFSYLFWPIPFRGDGLFQFILWLVYLCGFIVLSLYDFKWFLLPNKVVFSLTFLAVLEVLVVATIYHGGGQSIVEALLGAIAIAGFFYLLFQISRGSWIGGGDVKLGILLGILSGGFFDGFLVLFFSSLIGSLYALPQLITGKASRKSHLPFGPFLMLATVIVKLFGASIITWYKRQYF